MSRKPDIYGRTYPRRGTGVSYVFHAEPTHSYVTSLHGESVTVRVYSPFNGTGVGVWTCLTAIPKTLLQQGGRVAQRHAPC